jgi:hypothetical protein
VLLGDVPDQLLDDDRLADAGTAEEPDLAAPRERGQVVDRFVGVQPKSRLQQAIDAAKG